MKRIFEMIVFLVIMLVTAGIVSADQDSGVLSKLHIEASGTFDFYNRYVWRGFVLDMDPVIQPGFSLSTKGFTFSFWSSWDADNNGSANSDEIDYVFDYTKEFENFSVSVGHTYYDFPGTNGYSREFYLGVGLPIFLSPTLTTYFDYGDEDNGGGDGQYVILDLSHSITLFDEPEVTLDVGTSIGYNNELFINGQGGNFLVSAGLAVPLTENLSMSPNINYSVPFGDLKDGADGNQDDRFYGGVNLAYSF